MNRPNIDEQDIYNALSQITVDSSNLTSQVKSRLEDENNIESTKTKRIWTRSSVIAVAMSLLLVVTAAAVVKGNFNWFMERFNPAFGSIVKPIEVYSEDQGIRMEVIGAQKYDNRAIVYLSLQDITGQNRLTEQTDFRDGFSIKMTPQVIDKIADTKDEVDEGIGFSWGQKMIAFDEDTNTIYYEFNITGGSQLADPLELGSFLVYFDIKRYDEEAVDLSFSDIKNVETISIKDTNTWGSGGSNMPDNLVLNSMLVPGNYASMPHGEKDQWISNIGIVDGQLHVQTGRIFNKEFGSSDAHLSLKDSDGNLIHYDYSYTVLSDKDNKLIDIEEDDFADAIYKYEEFVFDIGRKDLNNYNLVYSGNVSTGIEGKWKVAANLSSSSENIRSLKNDILVEGNLFEYIRINPLGLEVIGSYKGEECTAGDMSVELETIEGIIPLEFGGGSQGTKERTFNYSWNAGKPIYVGRVIAININGVRITVED